MTIPRYTSSEYQAMREYFARPVPFNCACRPGRKCDYHVNAAYFAAVRAWETKIARLMEVTK